MNDRLVTVATFDLPHKAELAKSALKEDGIWAEVNDREVVSFDRFQLNVAEEDAVQAEIVLARLSRLEVMISPVSDEELERQAMAAPTEDEMRAAVAAKDGSSVMDPDDPQYDRERQATRALWWAAGGIFCTPAWAVGLYFLLTAAFRSGPLSANGRNGLRVAGVLAAVKMLIIVLTMTRVWNKLSP